MSRTPAPSRHLQLTLALSPTTDRDLTTPCKCASPKARSKQTRPGKSPAHFRFEPEPHLPHHRLDGHVEFLARVLPTQVAATEPAPESHARQLRASRKAQRIEHGKLREKGGTLGRTRKILVQR